MASPEHIVLVVFPFEDLSHDGELGVFCRAFGMDLVAELSRFRQFSVVAWPAPTSLDDLPGERIFDDLASDYHIQGTFRSDARHIRINVLLTDSRTREVIWGHRQEGPLEELPELQEDLLTGVVGVLQRQINADLLANRRRRAKVPFRAYEHWLRGMEDLRQGTLESDAGARVHFEAALALQPDYALAFSGMSLTYFNEWTCQLWDTWDICKTSAYEWAQKAIALDDQNYIAALVIGKFFLFDRAYETAAYYLRKSLFLNPNDPDTLIQVAAYLVYLGEAEEALLLFERTIKLAPANQAAYLPFGVFIHFELGQFEQAAALAGHAPGARWADADAFLAALYYHLGNEDRMQAHWQQFLANYDRLIAKGNAYTTDEVIEWLFTINPHRGSTNLEPFLRFISGNRVDRSAGKRTETRPAASTRNVFSRENGTWLFTFEGESIRLPEVKGFQDLRQLLAESGKLVHCATLMGSALDASGTRLFDDKARKAYEAEVARLQRAIREAEDQQAFGRLEKLQDEYDELLEHLTKQLGLKGRTREAGNPVEKARSAVTWRIRHAIARIEQHHPALGRHLAKAVKTGTFCAYEPERPVAWHTA